MVFSQSSHKAQTVLKVVNLDLLKTEKNDQEYGATEAVTRIDGYSNTAPSSPAPSTSCTEESLKTEPLYDSTMFHEMDFEFFQELDPSCYAPAKEEVVQTIDSFKKTEEKALNIDTPYIPLSPHGWEQFDVNSPLPTVGSYNNTPSAPHSPYETNMFNFTAGGTDTNMLSQDNFLDISSLPMVIGDLTSENNLAPVEKTWPQTAEPVEWINTPDTHYNLIYTNTHNAQPFIQADDSLDLELGSVMPDEVEIIDLVDPECIMSKEEDFGMMQGLVLPKRKEGLSVDISVRAPAWPGEISTPVILNDVIALEKEKCKEILDPPVPWLQNNSPTPTFTELKTSPKLDYEPITPKSESHVESDIDDSKPRHRKRRRHDSEDSDESYTPYSEQPPRKYKKRRPSACVKDLMLALESQPKARRGRPPKRRESAVSSVCSVDDNSSTTSTHEYKYRSLRDKNNEASKKSRLNRKLKEKQMEEEVVELQERNKQLKVRVDILEEMTKKLKNELMTAILTK